MPLGFALLKRPYSSVFRLSTKEKIHYLYAGEGSSPITHRFHQLPNIPAIATRYLCHDL